MPEMYTQLVAALMASDIPFQEYGWKTRPEGNHGVVSLDFEAGALDGDDAKLDKKYEASVDIFFGKARDRAGLKAIVETILNDICEDAWNMNSFQYEYQTGLFHIEWVCELWG